MSDGQLNASIEDYLSAAAMNTPPPQIPSDPLVSGVTPIEQLLRVLGLAANLSDPIDNATSNEQYLEREAMLMEAAERFAAHDADATQQLNDVAAQSDPVTGMTGTSDQAAAMAQQLPQMLSGVAGAIAGAVSGALQPLAQIPQQAAQGIQQAMQSGTRFFEQAAGDAVDPITDSDLDAALLPDDPFPSRDLAGLGDGDIGLGGGSTGGGHPGGPGGTAPTSLLGPPPVPVASTAPSSAARGPIAPPVATSAAPLGPGSVAGMPMVPPGSLAGTGGGEKDPKADTKRVSVPTVRNGAPVQGRLTAPALAPVVRKSEGAPVITRRIVAPHRRADGQSGEGMPDS